MALLLFLTSMAAFGSCLGAVEPPCPHIKGEPGLSGIPGRPGNPGLPGRNGNDGLPGLPGLQGLKGDPGEPRPGTGVWTPGEKGRKGYPGRPGLHGPKGFPGLKGTPGLPGLDGRPGFKGQAGTGGFHGQKGRAGDQGTPGDCPCPDPDLDTLRPTFYALFDNLPWHGKSSFTKVIFSDLRVNVMDCYFTTNQEFVAPFKGIFQFSVTAAADGSSIIPLSIFKNQEEITSVGRSKSSLAPVPHGSTSVLVSLDTGDSVTLHQRPEAGWIGSPAKTNIMFSGHLVSRL